MLALPGAMLLAGGVLPAVAQTIHLFERGAPSIAEFDADGGYRIPDGDWSRYRAWMARGAPLSKLVTAFIDSGVLSEHPYIKPVLAKSIDLTGEGPEDRIGHGTFVTLIFLMTAGEVVGPVISIKVAGTTTPSDPEILVKALDRAGIEGANVVNVSAGVFLECGNARDPARSPYIQSCDETPICAAVTALEKKHTITIAAVGNTPGKTACPACCKDAIAVGAADENGKPAPYSGDFADILAPGNFGSVPIDRGVKPRAVTP
ncbi:S8 family serine peptidase [Ancylobacter terrae]|uniref:S8 family serine peptidase n=1 Tax=Ancylobacter sp. sgz301288 TaxID=3342077 RepID=UPI0038598142